jgi:hypothetical protein
MLEAINDGARGVRTIYTLKAFAVSDHLAPSDVATFTYVIEPSLWPIVLRSDNALPF